MNEDDHLVTVELVDADNIDSIQEGIEKDIVRLELEQQLQDIRVRKEQEEAKLKALVEAVEQKNEEMIRQELEQNTVNEKQRQDENIKVRDKTIQLEGNGHVENMETQALESRTDQEHHKCHNEASEEEPNERAAKLLSVGGMPLFPPGRREWGDQEVLTLISTPTSLKWPPKNWKAMTAEQKYFNWEFAIMALEFVSGSQLQSTKEELLLKYNFLALPGSRNPNVEEEKTVNVKARYYLYQVLKGIVRDNPQDANTEDLLKMLELSISSKQNCATELCHKIDQIGIKLRLGDGEES